ncbi:hypothetical protein NPIL_378321 [Nephila pilipes]|uniref:Uncharacterized protein n=1 Tax=Nephila pilipes TaxID=299642 RepID=A0A8X6UE36_NEPPI|nr:hypothetical protein NPIL_378321 [Nephila pilipes]
MRSSQARVLRNREQKHDLRKEKEKLVDRKSLKQRVLDIGENQREINLSDYKHSRSHETSILCSDFRCALDPMAGTEISQHLVSVDSTWRNINCLIIINHTKMKSGTCIVQRSATGS